MARRVRSPGRRRSYRRTSRNLAARSHFPSTKAARSPARFRARAISIDCPSPPSYAAGSARIRVTPGREADRSRRESHPNPRSPSRSLRCEKVGAPRLGGLRSATTDAELNGPATLPEGRNDSHRPASYPIKRRGCAASLAPALTRVRRPSRGEPRARVPPVPPAHRGGRRWRPGPP